MKKLVLAILLVALLTPCALAETTPEASLDEKLTAMAQDAAEKMTELCGTDSYIQIYFNDSEVLETAKGWAGDWAKRENCRRAAVAFIRQDAVEALIPSLLASQNMDELTPYGDYIAARFLQSLPSMLNGFYGAAWLASTTVITWSDIQVLDGLEPGYAYVLLDYFGSDHPLVLAFFRIQENGAVSMTALFVHAGEYTDIAFAAADASINLHKLVSDKLADQEPDLAKAVLTALDEISLTEVYY
ncbi:MAG: hypothetical protein IKO07_05185 [Clostridia bacterium]|nr:hypothetical protein [Clostridia bacterium]